MAGKGSRFVASLFGIHLNEDMPKLQSLVPQRIISEVNAGQLPKFNPSHIKLHANEECHFMDRVAMAVKQSETSYISNKGGSNYRMTDNWSIHSNRGMTRPVEQEWYEFKEGILFVTNERVIFVENEYGFEKKMINLTAITPYSDAISFQFGNHSVTFITQYPEIINTIIQRM